MATSTYVVEIGGRKFRLSDEELSKALVHNLGKQTVDVLDIVV